MLKQMRYVAAVLAAVLCLTGCSSADLVSDTSAAESEAGSEMQSVQDSEEEALEETEEELQEPEADDADAQDGADTDSVTEEEEDGSGDAETADGGQSRTVAIYYIDEDSAEMISMSTEITDEYDIWVALQGTGILTEDCQLLNFTENGDGTLDLDFNAALGDRIRSFGTTGETEILACLINTYLDAYDCEKIHLTEEGGVFETSSGANYEGYAGRLEL